MFAVLIGMFFALIVGVAIMVAVALPARREGRELFTPEGEEALRGMRDRVADAIPGVPSPSR